VLLRRGKPVIEPDASAISEIVFDAFRLDLQAECLWHAGEPLRLRRKAFSLLRHLLENSGRLLTKQELLDAVWPDVAVTDAVLKVCISEVRKALGDNAAEPRFVVTVHRRGYRFVAPAVQRTAKARTTSAPAGLVGRSSVLASLDDAWEESRAGSRRTVFISGEPGIGKTTVVEAFLNRMAGNPQVWTCEGQCLAT